MQLDNPSLQKLLFSESREILTYISELEVLDRDDHISDSAVVTFLYTGSPLKLQPLIFLMLKICQL